MSHLDIKLDGAADIAARLARAEDLVRDPRPALQVIGETVLEDGVHRAFRQQKSPDGKKWPKLAKSTLRGFVPGTAEDGSDEPKRGRRRKSYGRKPLIRRGTYRNSWNWQLTPDGRGVSIGTPFEHAKYHEQPPDGPNGKGIIPQRRALPYPNAAGRFPKHVQSGINEALDTLIEAMTHA